MTDTNPPTSFTGKLSDVSQVKTVQVQRGGVCEKNWWLNTSALFWVQYGHTRNGAKWVDSCHHIGDVMPAMHSNKNQPSSCTCRLVDNGVAATDDEWQHPLDELSFEVRTHCSLHFTDWIAYHEKNSLLSR